MSSHFIYQKKAREGISGLGWLLIKRLGFFEGDGLQLPARFGELAETLIAGDFSLQFAHGEAFEEMPTAGAS